MVISPSITGIVIVIMAPARSTMVLVRCRGVGVSGSVVVLFGVGGGEDVRHASLSHLIGHAGAIGMAM